jgi:ribosome-binding protein aMBF1 (putative translation factor)
MLARMRTNARSKPSAVRTARENAGLTREQLAVKASVSSTTVYLAERAGLLSENTAKKLAVVLGCDPATLLP